MTWKGQWPGTWAVNCMICGFRFPSDKILKRWDGLYVCQKDFEPRHPQTLIKVRGETAVPDFVNEDPVVYIGVCDIVSSSCYSDIATADCALADNQQFTYAFLVDFFKNGHGGQ